MIEPSVFRFHFWQFGQEDDFDAMGDGIDDFNIVGGWKAATEPRVKTDRQIPAPAPARVAPASTVINVALDTGLTKRSLKRQRKRQREAAAPSEVLAKAQVLPSQSDLTLILRENLETAPCFSTPAVVQK